MLKTKKSRIFVSSDTIEMVLPIDPPYTTSHQKMIKGDSTLQTLHSDTKINILHPNLNVKMFYKGGATNIENTFSVLFPPNKKML